jgi:hypothetical protein
VIVDYSVLRPTINALKASGVTAAGRYIGWDDQPGFRSIGKNITAAEARTLISAGISVFLAFEYAADAVTKGAGQGRKDGELASRQLAALGAPAGMTVYFAVDFDIPDYAPHLAGTPPNAIAKLGPAAGYFRAISMLTRSYRVGVYGGYWAVSRLLDAGLAVAGWQTVAWSGGRRDPRAVLYQLAGTAPIAGADVDVHEATGPDFGQWPRPGSQPGLNWTETLVNTLPALRQGDADLSGAVQFVHRLQALVKVIGDINGLAGASAVKADGTFGQVTWTGVLRVQQFFGLAEDGICGPATWAALVAGQRP